MPSCPPNKSYTIRSGDSLWQIANRFQTTKQAIISANPGLNTNNLRIGQVIHIPQRCDSYQMPAQLQPSESISSSKQTLRSHMRLLWEQHVYWTRMVILSIAFELPDATFVTNRLLRNPKDFKVAFKPFYGQDIAAKFSTLLTDHLVIAADLIKAAKAGDTAKAANAEKRWYANADQIASFLGSINPYWSTQKWQKMLYDHLAMTKTEAVDILTHKYADSISMFEDIEKQALAMADMMTKGIITQFPGHFM